jgi:hypothetical protein
MPEPHMMFVIDREFDLSGKKEFAVIRVRSATERITHFLVNLPNPPSESQLKQAVKDCVSWIIENAPINGTYIINTSI